MPFPLQNAALIIVGHGSTLNPDSSTPTHRCADEIRRRGLFAEVVCAFWKEEPSMREVFYMVKSDNIFIVPNFISEGYFTREVLPRELRLDGPVTQRDGKTICYCDPVGIHPGMTRLLLKRADEVAAGVPRSETSLIIVGHGTSLNENSRRAIEAQVAFIRAGSHGFAEVLDAYMEEAPFIAKWDELASAPNIVVVPFFIADGLHSYQDIPVLLGIESEPSAAASVNEVFRHNPHELRGRRLYYSSAVGTEPLMAEVILDQVNDFSTYGVLEKKRGPLGEEKPTKRLDSNFTIGQVRAARQDDGSWLLLHASDRADDAGLRRYESAIDAREIVQYDEAGAFRSLKSAPSLRRGWLLKLPNETELRLALDFFYPAALGMQDHFASGTLHPVNLRETLGRQTGMYRFANTITDEDAQNLVACTCDARSKCLRRILWQFEPGRPLTKLTPEKAPPPTQVTGEIPVLCVEACTHVVSGARKAAAARRRAADRTES